ncbi:MAG: extracellular solute-binding protein [Anaerocolumna sp.]
MFKKMKKLCALFLTGMIAMQLVACGNVKTTENVVEDATENAAENVKTEDTKSDEAKSGEGVNLTIWHQSVSDTDPSKAIITASLEEYHKTHPNVTIVQDSVTGEQYKTKIKTAYAAGEAPDISYMFGGGSFVKPYIDAGQLLPIDEYLTEDIKSKLLDGMLENCEYSGKIYTLPSITFLANLYCNRQMFEDAGAKYPATWTEFVDACKKLKAAGHTPIIIGEKDRWPGMYWYDIIAQRQAGNAAVMSAFKNPKEFNSQPFIKAAEKMQELVKIGAFNDSMLSMSYDEMIPGFAAGQAAMVFQANWIHPTLEDESAVTYNNIDVMAFPVFEDGAGTATEFYGGGTDGYYINAKTEHPDVAVDYLFYLSQKIGREGYAAGAGLPCWNTEGVDESSLTALTKGSAALMETGTSYITWWDNILTPEGSETHKDLIAELLALRISPEEFAEKMSQLDPSQLY